MAFKAATKEKARARIALIGPSGSGKTFSALRIARGLVGEHGKIAVIDSERGSASKYADRFRFAVDDLESFHPDKYIDSLMDARLHGFDVVIIDSLSHAWMGKDGALEQVDKAAARSRTGNSFGAWREVTPMHNALVDAILQAPFHIIATMRAKTDYVQEKNADGKTEIRKVGLAPVQREGLEYEFDVVGEMDMDNKFVVSKTRCPALARAVIKEPGEDLGKTLAEWLSGATAEDALTYVQAEADLCFSLEDVSALKRLLFAKGGAYFTDAVKAILVTTAAKFPKPEASQPAAAAPAPSPEAAPAPIADPAAAGEPAPTPAPEAAPAAPAAPVEDIDPETGKPFTNGIAAARAYVRKEIQVCKTGADLDKLQGLMQKTGGAYLSAKVTVLITEAREAMYKALAASNPAYPTTTPNQGEPSLELKAA